MVALSTMKGSFRTLWRWLRRRREEYEPVRRPKLEGLEGFAAQVFDDMELAGWDAPVDRYRCIPCAEKWPVVGAVHVQRQYGDEIPEGWRRCETHVRWHRDPEVDPGQFGPRVL